MDRRRHLATAALLSLAVAACVGGSTSPTPAGSLPPNVVQGTNRQFASVTPPPSAMPSARVIATSLPTSFPVPPSSAPFDAELDAALPTEIGGVPAWHLTGPADRMAGGHVCSVICDGEAEGLAKALGVPVGDIHVGVAMAQNSAIIVAFRAPGFSGEALRDRWIQTHVEAWAKTAPPQTTWSVTVSGKPVTWAWYSIFISLISVEYLYAHADILYAIRYGAGVDLPKQLPPPTPPEVVAAIAALP